MRSYVSLLLTAATTIALFCNAHAEDEWVPKSEIPNELSRLKPVINVERTLMFNTLVIGEWQYAHQFFFDGEGVGGAYDGSEVSEAFWTLDGERDGFEWMCVIDQVLPCFAMFRSTDAEQFQALFREPKGDGYQLRSVKLIEDLTDVFKVAWGLETDDVTEVAATEPAPASPEIKSKAQAVTTITAPVSSASETALRGLFSKEPMDAEFPAIAEQAKVPLEQVYFLSAINKLIYLSVVCDAEGLLSAPDGGATIEEIIERHVPDFNENLRYLMEADLQLTEFTWGYSFANFSRADKLKMCQGISASLTAVSHPG
jgi:hypothetical protein